MTLSPVRLGRCGASARRLARGEAPPSPPKAPRQTSGAPGTARLCFRTPRRSVLLRPAFAARMLVFAPPKTNFAPMLSDRPYMRGDYQRERTSVLTWLICTLVAAFIMQLVMGGSWFRDGRDVTRALALSVEGLQSGRVWTLLTHSFLHDPHFLLHLVGNIFLLFLLGRELVPMLGTRRFLALFGVATVVGGMFWAAAHWQSPADQLHLGATAAIAGLFIVYACFFPNQELNFLLFFLFPVTLKPKYVAGGLFLFDLAALVFLELPGTALPYDVTIASSAHLGGMLTGFAYYRFVFDTHWFGRTSADSEIELPRWLKRQPRKPADIVTLDAPAAPVPPTPGDLKAEVDRILDKINSEGVAALTDEEKRILAEARDQLSRR